LVGRCARQGNRPYVAVRISVRRVDESEVNILAGLELEPLWLVEVKSHRTIAALLLVLQPRFVFCGDHACHCRYAMETRIFSTVPRPRRRTQSIGDKRA